jgi:hypothetical protein
LDIAIATLPEEVWRAGPWVVNTEIRRLIEAQTPVEAIPAQGAGPHVVINSAGKIDIAPPEDIDAEGNNVARIRQLLPLVRQAATDLAGHLNPNIHPELARNVSQYRGAIGSEGETIPWGILFGIGVRLDNAAVAARREIPDRLHTPLEDAAQEALDSLLTLHGPLILATAEGRELMGEADRYGLTVDQQKQLRKDAEAVAAGLRRAPDIIEPPAADVVQDAAAMIGEGRHAERATAYGIAAVKNVATIAIPTGVVAGVAWWIGDFAGGVVAGIAALPLGHSRRIRAALSALKLDYDRLFEVEPDVAISKLRRFSPFRDFVIANEEPLRRIAENTTQLRWMLGYIDFIVRKSGSDDGAN